MKTLLIIATTLLLNAAKISQCVHARNFEGGSGVHMIYPHEGSHPKNVLIGSGLLLKPVESTQPKSIDDCEEQLQKPSERDLNERRLLKRLGGKIDERFLSVTEPSQMSDEPIVQRVLLRGITTAEKNFLRQVIRNETIPKMGKTSLSVERFLMKWLIHKSDCPVERTWKHLGNCYWPRWISMGRCVNKQCSWPHGMSCVPSDPVSVMMLRWHCRKVRDGRKGKRPGAQASNISCRWSKFRYPIINNCACKCKEKPHVSERLLPVRPLGN